MPIAGAMPVGASLPPVVPPGTFPAIEAGVGAYLAPGASPAIVQASGEGPRLVLGARKFGLSSVLEGVGGHPATIEDPEIIAMLEHIEINLNNITKIDDVLKGMRGQHIMFLECMSGGRRLDVPMDTGCTLTMVSGRHRDHLRKVEPSTEYHALKTPIPVSNAEEGKSLFAVGLAQVPLSLDGGPVQYYTALVVPGLAWDVLFGQNHLALVRGLTDHAARTITLRMPDEPEVVCKAPSRQPIPHRSYQLEGDGGLEANSAGVSAFGPPKGLEASPANSVAAAPWAKAPPQFAPPLPAWADAESSKDSYGVSKAVSVSGIIINRGPKGLEVLALADPSNGHGDTIGTFPRICNEPEMLGLGRTSGDR